MFKQHPYHQGNYIILLALFCIYIRLTVYFILDLDRVFFKPERVDSAQTFAKIDGFLLATDSINTFPMCLRNIDNKAYALILVIGLFVSCSPSTRITGSWIDPQTKGKPRSGKSVFIATLSKNIEVRNVIEDALARAAEARGIPALKSTAYFTPDFYQQTTSAQTLLSKIKNTGAGSVLTVALIDQASDTRFVPGRTAYAPFATYSWYGGFYSYYNYWQRAFYEPGYYVTDKTYFLETNLYDLQSGKLVWSAQSESVNPGTVENFARVYPEILIKRMISDGLLAPETAR